MSSPDEKSPYPKRISLIKEDGSLAHYRLSDEDKKKHRKKRKEFIENMEKSGWKRGAAAFMDHWVRKPQMGWGW